MKIDTPNLSQAVVVSITVHVFCCCFFFSLLCLYILIRYQNIVQFKAGFLRESDNKPSKCSIKEKIEISRLKF